MRERVFHRETRVSPCCARNRRRIAWHARRTGAGIVSLVAATVLALAAGASLGLLGGGGSVLIVPILVYVAGLGPRDAVATSLLVVGATSVAALVPHARAGRVKLRTGAIFGASSMAGAFVAGSMSSLVPPSLLLAGLAVVMIATAGAMLRGRRGTPIAEPDAAKLALRGVAVGGLTGLLGAGGGFLIVPALVLFGGISMGEAVGTSLLVIAMNSLAGLVAHLSAGSSVDPTLAVAITSSAVLGSVIGASLVGKCRPESLREAFGGLVLAMGGLVLGIEVPRALGHEPSAADWPWLALPAVLALAAMLATRWARARRPVEAPS
jgi:uncharacterized membrane protein YfcA